MVGRFISVLNRELVNINHAAFFLGLFAFISQILGLFRDRALSHIIGPGSVLDVYYASFRAPDLIYIILGSIVSVTVLMPFFAMFSKKDGVVFSQESQIFLNSIFSIFLIVVISISIIGMIFMPLIAKMVAPGFSSVEYNSLVSVGRIMFLSPIFLGLSSLFGSVTQLYKKFFIFSLSPVFYNLGIIFGIIFLYPSQGISGLVWGVVIGAMIHFLVQALFLKSVSVFPKFSLKQIEWSLVKNVLKSSIPRTFGMVMNNIAFVVVLSIASFFSTGVISVFNLSFNIQSLALSVVGISYAVAAFPTLSLYFANNDRENFFSYLETVIRQILFLTIPITVLFIVLRAQIVRVILGSGSFSWNDTKLVAATVAFFAISIPAQSLIALFVRTYYAGGNVKRPLFITTISSSSIIILSVVFLYIFKYQPSVIKILNSIARTENIIGSEVLLLALAYSMGIIMNVVLLWIYIKRDFKYQFEFKSLEKNLVQHILSGLIIGVFAYLSLGLFSLLFDISTFWHVLFQGFFAGVVGIFFGGVFLFSVKNKEIIGLIHAFEIQWKKRFFTPIESFFGEKIDF